MSIRNIYKTLRYLWHETDYTGLANSFNTVNCFNMFTTNLTHDSLWEAFTDTLNSVIKNCVPAISVHDKQSRRIQNKTTYPKNVRHAVSKKRCLWKRHRQNPLDTNILLAYKAAEVKCRDMITGFEVRKEREIIHSKNNGSFFRHVNDCLSNGRGTGTLIDAGSPVTNDKEKTNLFNNYFSSVCTKDNGDIPAVNKIVLDNVALDDIVFNRNTVLRALKKIKPNESSGPDNLPIVFFRKLSNVLAGPLSILFSSFMSIGKLTEYWKMQQSCLCTKVVCLPNQKIIVPYL